MTPDVFNWCHPPQIEMESRKHSRILTNIYKPFVPCTYAPPIKRGNGKPTIYRCFSRINTFIHRGFSIVMSDYWRLDPNCCW